MIVEERELVEEQRCSSCGSTGHRRSRCYVPTEEIDTPEGRTEAFRQARARGLGYQPSVGVYSAVRYRERRLRMLDFRPAEDDGGDHEFVAVAVAWGMFST